MKLNKIIIILLIISTALLSGCWDKVEINERGFILGMGIDKLSEKEKQEPYDSIMLEFKVPNVALLGTKQTPLKDPTFYFSGKGESFSTVIEEIESRAPFMLELSHMKVIILGRGIVEDPLLFRNVLDGIERERMFSRKIYILAAAEDAKDIIEIKPTENNIVGIYLRDILRRTVKEGRTVDSNLNNVARDIGQQQSTVLPIVNIIEDKKGINVHDSVVIKDYKAVGELTDNETRLLNLIKRDNEHIIDINVQHKGIPVTYDISKTRRKINVDEKNGKIVLNININTEGDITQHRIGIKGAIEDEKQIKEVEKLVEDKIKKVTEDLVLKLQKEYNTDVIGVKENIYEFKPKLYKKVSKDWDEYFRSMEVNIQVDSKIRRIGIVR